MAREAVTTSLEAQSYLAKAQENAASAASELVNGRYNACANRCYYAAFQAAVAALLRAGIRPSAAHGEWGHAFVQARFAGELIARRKLYPASLRDVLLRLQTTRRRADYEPTPVSQTQATRSLRLAQDFVASVLRGEVRR